MARTAKKKSSKKSTTPINGGAVVRALTGEGVEAFWRVGTALVVVVLIVAWATGRGALKEAVAGGEDLTPDIVFVTDADAAASGVPQEVVVWLQQLVLAGYTTDPFDREALLRVRESLLASGWFVSIDQVQRVAGRASEKDGSADEIDRDARVGGSTLEIECVWRRPRAVVQPRRGAPVLVGADSAPMRMPSELSASGLVQILNPLEPAPTGTDGRIAYGRAWGLSDVSDAIALLRLLAERRLEGPYIASIDVSDPERIRITTTNGAVILWGGPVDARRPGEASVEERLGVLSTILRDPTMNVPSTPWNITTGSATRDARPRP